MSCNEVRERLDDYVDGLLDPQSQSKLRRHLADCAECSNEEQRLRELLAGLAELPESIEPSESAWIALAERIDTEETTTPPSAWPRWRYLAAACVALVLVALGYVGRIFIEPASPPTAVTPPIASDSRLASDSAVRPSELAFIEVQKELRAELDRRRPHLSADTIRTVESNLEVVEASILEIRNALDADPGNRNLNRLLVAAHQREIGLLRQVTQMTTRL